MTMPSPKDHSLPISKRNIKNDPTPMEYDDRDGKLTENESSFIMSATLRAKHRKDPAVISFIDSFIRCKSIAQASSECGIHRSVGYSFRHRKDIATCIQKLIDKSAVKHGFDSSEILQRVKEVVDFDPVDLMNADGTFKSNLHGIPPEARRCLKKLKVKNLFNQVEDLNGMKTKIIIGEVIEYEFYDKLKASELVGKEKEMFKTTTRVEHDVTKNMASVLLESAKRADKMIEESNIQTVEVINVKG